MNTVRISLPAGCRLPWGQSGRQKSDPEIMGRVQCTCSVSPSLVPQHRNLYTCIILSCLFKFLKYIFNFQHYIDIYRTDSYDEDTGSDFMRQHLETRPHMTYAQPYAFYGISFGVHTPLCKHFAGSRKRPPASPRL